VIREGQGRVTFLCYLNRISLFYSILPIAGTEWFRLCDFTQSLRHCLEKDDNRVLVILRYFSRSGADRLEALEKLRAKYERIVWFDDGDGAGSTSFEVLPFVDFYWKKQLFRDKTNYMRPLYGRQLYTDYFHRVYGVVDDPPQFRSPIEDPADLGKLRLAWNIGAGAYPIRPRTQRLGVAVARALGRVGMRTALRWGTRQPVRSAKSTDKACMVFARFSPIAHRPTINHQRHLATELLRTATHLPSAVGNAAKRRYDRDMASAAVTLSPFGWGEVCFRDFEAIRTGSALAKPDTSHLITWPDVYRRGETYEALEWDGSDLVEKLLALLADTDRQTFLVDNARDALESAERDLVVRVGERFAELVP
jgi:hypothetical protein